MEERLRSLNQNLCRTFSKWHWRGWKRRFKRRNVSVVIPQSRYNYYTFNVLEGVHRKDDNFTELHIAVKKYRVSDVQELVQNKTLINAKTQNGVTSLLLSCFQHIDATIAEILINSGADVNLSDNVRFSPLLAACQMGKIEVAELLLKSAANINHQDDCKNTALHYAIENNHLPLVDLLLQSGADISLLNCNGLNALMLAVFDPNVSKDIIVLLVKQGADVNVNVDGVMPATLALGRRDPTIFDYLWDLTDIEVLRKENQFQNFIKRMFNSNWITPNKIQYFYKVLDTPGVQLNVGGYFGIVTGYMENLDSDDAFLSIDVCGIVTKLMEYDAALDKSDIEAFIRLSHRYTFDYKHKLFQILIKNNPDLNYFGIIRMSIRIDPEFTLLLLPYCISNNPIDILKYISSFDRLDFRMLKLINSILRLCTPSFELRKDCMKHLKSYDVLGIYYYYFVIASEFPFKKYIKIKYDLNPEEKVILPELYNEVFEFLSIDRVPTLKELSRDVIRKCLAPNCNSTEEYLSKLNILHLPKIITDIIQCKSVVSHLE